MMLYCSSFPSISAPIIHATKTSQLPNPSLNTSSNNSPPPSLLQRHHFPSKLHHLHQKLQPQTHNAHSTRPHSTRTYSHKCPPKKQPTPSPAHQSLHNCSNTWLFCFMQNFYAETPKTTNTNSPADLIHQTTTKLPTSARKQFVGAT
jgi:hypothetical protein